VRLGEPADESSADEAELLLGIEAGLDPQPAVELVEADGTALTSASSWWNYRLCKTCGHTFRRGDRVRVDQAARTVAHLEPALGCVAVPLADGSGESTEAAAFAAGLLAQWPPLLDMPVARISAGDWRLPSPGTGRRAPVCLYCGHTFRVGEYVVVCPCRAGEQLCGATVHRDPAAGLPCWERWRPDGVVTICPVTLAKTGRRPD
jgi:hypothetical protein